MELNEEGTNYCSHCLKITDERLIKMRFRDLQIPPITFQFCRKCWLLIANGDSEVISEMRDRHQRFYNPKAFSNFGAGNNGMNSLN